MFKGSGYIAPVESTVESTSDNESNNNNTFHELKRDSTTIIQQRLSLNSLSLSQTTHNLEFTINSACHMEFNDTYKSIMKYGVSLYFNSCLYQNTCTSYNTGVGRENVFDHDSRFAIDKVREERVGP